LQRIIDLYTVRFEELAQTMTLEMGSPITFSREVQATNALVGRPCSRAPNWRENSRRSADQSVPFGGYKQSGNGREHGVFGFEEFLEVKAILGYKTA
jgi:acyl-CoA reductase-like NAD-dependent aldehyde dehydrogenase